MVVAERIACWASCHMHVVFEFLGFVQFFPVEASGVGTEDDLYSLSSALIGTLSSQFHHLWPVALAARSYISANRDRGDPVDAAAGHLFHLRPGESIAMFDGVNTRSQCCGDTITADGVRRTLFPKRCVSSTMALASSSLKFTVTVQAPSAPKVAVVGVVLDPVRAVHDLLAHSFTGTFCTVDILHALRHAELPRIAERAVHSGGRHGPGCDLHVRAGDFPSGDGGLTSTSAYIAPSVSRSRSTVKPWERAICALRAARMAR